MYYSEERADLCKVVKTMFDRYETNAAGGNVSVRMNEQHIIMTPTLMSQQRLCDLSPYEILVIDMDEQVIEGDGRKTREINMHMACYREHPLIGCVMHAHAKESMVFASMGMSMPNLTESTQKLGEIVTLPFAPACSKELARHVRSFVRGAGDEVVPKAMLLHGHGIVVLDQSLRKAYDMLERIEYNAYVASKALIFDALDIKKIDYRKYDYNLEE